MSDSIWARRHFHGASKETGGGVSRFVVHDEGQWLIFCILPDEEYVKRKVDRCVKQLWPIRF